VARGRYRHRGNNGGLSQRQETHTGDNVTMRHHGLQSRTTSMRTAGAGTAATYVGGIVHALDDLRDTTPHGGRVQNGVLPREEHIKVHGHQLITHNHTGTLCSCCTLRPWAERDFVGINPPHLSNARCVSMLTRADTCSTKWQRHSPGPWPRTAGPLGPHCQGPWPPWSRSC
jgi:hypothetical protein